MFNKLFESKEIKQLKALAQSMPNDPEACFNLGTAYQKLGRYKDAVCEFKKTIKYIVVKVVLKGSKPVQSTILISL